jgi:hypothetical protein
MTTTIPVLPMPSGRAEIKTCPGSGQRKTAALGSAGSVPNTHPVGRR